MIYVYDILLNWFEEKKNIEFFEWDPKDELEHIKRIPLFRVTKETMKEFMKNTIFFSSSFLEKIKNKTESYCEGELGKIPYAFLIGDKETVLAFECNEKGQTLYRSHLLLEEEEEVLEFVLELETTTIEYKKVKRKESPPFLTRKEQKNRNYLLKELLKIKTNKEEAKLNYLYAEFYEEKDLSFEEKFEKIYQSTFKNFSKKQEEMIKILKLASKKRNQFLT